MNEAVVVDQAVSRLRAIGGGTKPLSCSSLAGRVSPSTSILSRLSTSPAPVPCCGRSIRTSNSTAVRSCRWTGARNRNSPTGEWSFGLLLRREERFYLGANLRMERLTKRNLRVGHTLSFCRKLASVRESQFHSTSSSAGSTEGRYHLCTLGRALGRSRFGALCMPRRVGWVQAPDFGLLRLAVAWHMNPPPGRCPNKRFP